MTDELTSHRSAIELKGVSVRFGNYTAVENTDLTVKEGEFVSLVGPTGCGKSTLLNAVAGLLTPNAGSVKVRDETVTGIDKRSGYLFQQDALLPWKTALDNVALGPTFQGIPRSVARVQAQDWLRRVNLTGFEDRYPHQLSGGMKKRVALAQTLILNPRILLMDEPFSALDVQTRNLMENQLLELWQQDRKSVLFVTHDLEEAIALSDRVVVLSAGPGSHPVGEFEIRLTRPRDVIEVRMTEDFLDLHRCIWKVLREEVNKSLKHGPA